MNTMEAEISKLKMQQKAIKKDLDQALSQSKSSSIISLLPTPISNLLFLSTHVRPPGMFHPSCLWHLRTLLWTL